METRIFKHKYENSNYIDDGKFYFLYNRGMLSYLKLTNNNFHWSYLLKSEVDETYISYDDMRRCGEPSLRLNPIYEIKIKFSLEKVVICLSSGNTHVDINGQIWQTSDIKSIDYTQGNFKIIEEI